MATIFSTLSKRLTHKGTWRRRLLITLIATVTALLTTTVAIAQYAQDFDLACRSNFTASSGTITGGNFGVISAMGLPMVPPADSSTAPTYSARSSSFAIRAGFLPVYAPPQALRSSPINLPDLAFVQRLPRLYKVAYFIRFGC